MIALEPPLAYAGLERTYMAETSIAHRKRFAQFFTPYSVARLMAKWALGNRNTGLVLDPAFGLGVFAKAIHEISPQVIVQGLDVDPHIIEWAAKAHPDGSKVEIRCEDYLQHDWDAKYDGIICNPPYFKFHDYDNASGIEAFEDRLDYRLSGFTNLYALFMLKSLGQLKAGGRMAYLVPSEFLNSNYGNAVKRNLLASGMLRHVIVIDSKENLFEGATTTASILLCANDAAVVPVRFTAVGGQDDWDRLSDLESDHWDCSGTAILPGLIDPDIKWRAYYQASEGANFSRLVPFSKYARVVRGIATGANEFFTFSAEKAVEKGIPSHCLLPTVCKAADVKAPFFTQSSLQELIESHRTAYLLNAEAGVEMSQSVQEYVRAGELAGIHTRHLTAHRKPWFALERRPPAPIWVGVFNRTGLKFIRNETQALNLTTFHCVYPHREDLFGSVEIDLLFAYLLTDVSKRIFSDNRREYGNGLHKFEPNDLNKAMCLDLVAIHKDVVGAILEVYAAFRNAVISGKPSQGFLATLNTLFEDQLGLSRDDAERTKIEAVRKGR